MHLQPGRVDHHVHRPAARLGARQRRGECQAGAAPRERGVVGHADLQAEQHRDGAEQAFGLPPRTTEGQAQQVPGLDRHLRVVARPTALTRARRPPRRERLRRDPHRQAAALLQRPVIGGPVLDAVARSRDLVTAWFIELVGHRASRVGSAALYAPPSPCPSRRTADLCTNAVRQGSAPRAFARSGPPWVWMLEARSSFSPPTFPCAQARVVPQTHARRRPAVSATASGVALPVTVASASKASRRYASALPTLATAAGLRQARAARCSRSGSGGRHLVGITAGRARSTQRTPPWVWPVTIRPCSSIWASWRRIVRAVRPIMPPRLVQRVSVSAPARPRQIETIAVMSACRGAGGSR